MGGRAWWATVHGVAKSRTQLSDFTFTFYFHALEKEMATHFSVLAWRIPGTGKPGGLPSMGSHRVGHDWSKWLSSSSSSNLCWPSKLIMKPITITKTGKAQKCQLWSYFRSIHNFATVVINHIWTIFSAPRLKLDLSNHNTQGSCDKLPVYSHQLLLFPWSSQQFVGWGRNE